MKIPLIQAILGDQWHQLAPLVRAHFDVAPSTRANPAVVVEGTMEEVTHHGIGRLLFPLLGLIGVLVPYLLAIAFAGSLVTRTSKNYGMARQRQTQDVYEPGSPLVGAVVYLPR